MWNDDNVSNSVDEETRDLFLARLATWVETVRTKGGGGHLVLVGNGSAGLEPLVTRANKAGLLCLHRDVVC